MSCEFEVFPDADSMSRRAASIFAEHAHDCIAREGVFSVAISGGATPLTLFRLLCSVEFIGRVDWDGVQFFWADERCVEPGSPESNYGSAYREMLGRLPLPAGNLHRIKGEFTPGRAADEYEEEIKDWFGRTGRSGFDLCLLGVGEDGHTASLFPGSDALSRKNRLAVPVYVETLQSWRVTVTLSVINGSSRVVFLVSGRNKAFIVNEILGQGGAPEAYPAGLVRPEGGCPLWLIDAEAASMLGGT